MPRSRPALGALLMSAATLGFAGMATMVKLMATALPEPELVFWRAAFSIPVLLVIVLRSRHAFLVRARWTIVWRTLFGIAAMLCFFYAVGRLSLAEAQMLIKIAPVWVALLSPWITGDRPGRHVWLCMTCSLAGVALVLGPSLSLGVLSLAGLAALASSFLSAMAHMQLRRLGRTDHPDAVVLNFTVGLLLISGALSIPVARVPEPGHWPLLVALGLFAMTGQMFMTGAYKVAAAPLVATVGYVSIPVASLLDWLLWGTVPTGWAVAGGLLIMGSGVVLAQGGKAATGGVPAGS